MRCLLLWTHLSLLLFLIFCSRDLTALGSCQVVCGKVSIRFPFGIGKGCYLNEWFEIQCKNSTSGELVPYLPKINNEVVQIDLPNRPLSQYTSTYPYGSLRIKTKITSIGCANSSNDGTMLGEPLNLTGSPFTVGGSNILVAVGCNNRAMLTTLKPILVGCISSCGPIRKGDLSSCNGYGCCQANTPDEVGQVIVVSIEDPSTNITTERGCRVAFLTDEFDQYTQVYDPQWFYDRQHVTVELKWGIPMMYLSDIKSLGCRHEVELVSHLSFPCVCNTDYEYTNSTSCVCEDGYRGNPYLLGGCKDIDECQQVNIDGSSEPCSGGGTCINTPGSFHCLSKKDRTLQITIGLCVGFGMLIIFGVVLWLYKFINRKKKFFIRNGGLLLKQQLTSTKGNIEKTKVFSSKELKKATENFSSTRVLGQGGQGTVYKGMLVDGRIVAVKKSKVVDEDKLEEFINEVVILSQINHRNIVKLIGCCLETEVPLLVYEFISNGNLFEHLHGGLDGYMPAWEMRLHIIIDIAGALSYLHSAVSSPIFHRDIKSTNIMLDEKCQAKVSDFGTSRSVTVDRTHLTTVVSGTAGYVDPEYFLSSRFTDKSDVYSFGVVLVELITGEKPVSFLRSQENRTLATYFIFAMEDNRLVDIIDPRIKDDCKLEQVMAAAQLARRCLYLNGKNRPSMREVSMELERIRSPSGESQSQVHIVKNDVKEVAVEFNIGVESCNNVAVTAPLVFQENVATTSWVDAEPLFPRQTW